MKKLLLKLNYALLCIMLLLVSFKASAQVNISFPEVVFTDMSAISKGNSSTAIMNKLIALIDNTPAGQSIHVSIYMINYQPLMNALKNAETRGVDLHVIVDMSRSDSQVTNATSLPWLQNNLTNSEIIVTTSDVSINSINHHKHALFSGVNTTAGLATNVTFQTSHNFTTSDMGKIQDALIFNDTDIYNAFLSNWNVMKQNASSGMMANFNYITHNLNANTKLAFFPRITGGVYDNGDDIVDNLNAISDVANAKIRIAMSDWSDSRPAIVDKLIQLRNQGAAIEVYAKDAAGTQTKTKLRQLATLGATVRIFNLGEGAAAKFNIHAKMMLIEGLWNGQANAKVIMTGSHNYTDGAVKTNNEVLVTLVNSSLFTQYDNYFESLKTVVPVIAIAQLNMSSIDLTSGNNSNVATFNSTASIGGIINSFVSRGAGLRANTGLSEGYSSSHLYAYTTATKSTYADAYSRDEYLQIQFETKNAIKTSLNRIEWNIRKSAATAATHYRWYYSINSTNKEDFKPINSVDQAFVHNSTAAIQPEIDLSNISELQDIVANTKVYLRLYIIGAINTSSTFGFRNLDGAPGFNLVGDVDNVLTNNLLGWDLSTIKNGARTDGNEVSLTSNHTNTNILASQLKRGPGLNADAEAVVLQRGFTSVSSNVTTTLQAAETNGNYFAFDVTPKANVSVSLSELHINLRRSSAGGNMYLWKYKVDDGEFVSIGTETSFTSTNTNGVYQPIVKLDQIAELQNVKNSAIEFRLYVWGFNTANSGTFAIGRSADNYDLALQVQGTSTYTPLPVSLTSFEAKKTNNVVNLTWETASEQNNSHFDVLKSFDGKNWQLLTNVLGSANSNKAVKYSSTDHHPAFGANYYQLKQVDFDGTSSLSKIEVVNFNVDTKQSLKVNYTDNTLKLFVNKTLAEQTEIVIYSVDGRKISSKTTYINHGSSVIALPTTLAKGVYLVKIKSSSNELTEKFIAN